MTPRALCAVCVLAGALAFGGGWLLGWVNDPGLRPPAACQGLFCSSIVATSPSSTPTPARTVRPTTPPPRRVIPVPAPSTSAPPPITTTPPVTTALPSTAAPSATPTTEPVEPTVTETPEPQLLSLIGR